MHATKISQFKRQMCIETLRSFALSHFSRQLVTGINVIIKTVWKRENQRSRLWYVDVLGFRIFRFFFFFFELDTQTVLCAHMHLAHQATNIVYLHGIQRNMRAWPSQGNSLVGFTWCSCFHSFIVAFIVFWKFKHSFKLQTCETSFFDTGIVLAAYILNVIRNADAQENWWYIKWISFVATLHRFKCNYKDDVNYKNANTYRNTCIIRFLFANTICSLWPI